MAVIITFDICMHITSGQGWVKSFFININLVRLVISCTFPPLNDLVTVFPIKNRLSILTYRKIVEGQPRVIVYTNNVEFASPMLHTTFQDHRTFGSGKEDYYRFFPYIGAWFILFMLHRKFIQTYDPPSHGYTT